MRKIVVVALLAVALPTTAAAQWEILSETVNPFTDALRQTAQLSGEDNHLAISYVCIDGQETLSAIFGSGHDGNDVFAHGSVQIRFDDRPAETAEWSDEDTILIAPIPLVLSYMRSMTQHQKLLLGVTSFVNDLVIDRFDLTGTAAMLEQVNCGG